jgi:WhiB family redox-sensing transcriptional regulator
VQPLRTISTTVGTDWMHDAACANITHVDMFDLDCGLEQAITLCATCPVGDHCLDYAIQHDLTEGVWGGEWGARLLAIVKQGRRQGRR